ncbi:MAG: hypothetical protein KDI28_12715, partial [Pseudomonadales bacterium]|nr:hypothetical protein [Pseudomonadales bacterium]
MNKKNSFNTAMLSLIGTGFLLAVFGYVNAQGEPPEVIETSSHVFTRMADGVYQVTGTRFQRLSGDIDLKYDDTAPSLAVGMAS